MRYTAKLVGVPGLERPQESMGNSEHFLEQWAKATLERWPQGRVEIWETVLQLKKTLHGGDYVGPKVKDDKG